MVLAPKTREEKEERLNLLEEKRRLKVQQEYLRRSLRHLYGMPWYPWAWDFFQSKSQYNFLVAANQISKAIDDSTLIPTPDGFVLMGDLKVGDYVFGADGNPTKIVAIPFKNKAKCYHLKFDDGSSVVASNEHRWICKTEKERFRKSYTSSGSKKESWSNPDFDTWVEKSTDEIIECGKYAPDAGRVGKRVSIPLCLPVQYENKNELFDPYFVGLLLGDGGLTGRSVILTNPEQEIRQYVKDNYLDVKETGQYGLRINGIQQQMRDIGLMGVSSLNKTIPKQYLEARLDDRINLLRGLMDTDGTASKTAMSYSTSSKLLKDDFVKLVTSLGGKAKVKKRKAGYRNKEGEYIPCNDSYNIRINIDICPFRLTRKADRFYIGRNRQERIIYQIENAGERFATCITVDNIDGSFLCTEDYIVTHNSSTQIRKCIHWSTAPEIWPELWPTRPTQFWYFYPDKGVGTIEYKEKWVKEWMPLGPNDVDEDGNADWHKIIKEGAWHDHPIYGWKPTFKAGMIESIQFNSGVTVYFKSYEQGATALQTASVYAVFCDEELPEELLSELQARCFSPAINGYFHLVFTATIGQEIWRATMEEKGKHEKFVGAFKRQISMFECLLYMDGSPSPWTKEKIEEIIRNCKDESEVQRRVYGRFVIDKDRKYVSFQRSKNVKPEHKLPKNWLIYAGVDIGSGGTAHPAAICFVGVSPDFTKGRVFKGWRGDGNITDASDILDKFLELRGKMKCVGQYYDHQSKDFFTVASRRKIPFMKADKGRESGEGLLNTLFKNDILAIYDTPELLKLARELETLKSSTPKPTAKDDFIDSLRFAVTQIPWDFSVLNKKAVKAKDPYANMSEREKERRGLGKKDDSGADLIMAEIDLANESYDYGLDEGDCDYETDSEDYY